MSSSSEKSTFSQTCSLLSQYLKEKGSFGDLTLGITRAIETNGSPEAETSCHSATTMELFPTNATPQNFNLFSPNAAAAAYPQHSEVPTLVNSSSFKSMSNDPKAAQLTMFYDGKVIVFDDFPADKVEEIMSFAARKETPQRQNNSSAYGGYTQPQPSVIPKNSMIPQPPSVCELPIARKASLHRFLEKRKDRISAKEPYQTNKSISAPVKPAESIPWLGLGPNSTQV